MEASQSKGLGEWEDLARRRMKILVVDDEPINLHLMFNLFGEQHEIYVCRTGEEAITFFVDMRPDFVLMDVVMPGIGGLEACRRIKQLPGGAEVGVIFITGLSDVDHETQCWEAGAVDFVTKPINPITLRRRLDSHITLRAQADKLREFAWIDGLTGVKNRRYLDRWMRDYPVSGGGNEHASIIMLDVDHFKAFNDKYGHLAGDDCLRRVAAAMKAQLRRSDDALCRYGGEEFACLLPGADIKKATAIADRLIDSVRVLAIPHEHVPRGIVTASAGVASDIVRELEASDSLLERADRCLYYAKQRGRNCVASERNLG